MTKEQKLIKKCTWIFNGVDVARIGTIANWCYELRLILLKDARADVDSEKVWRDLARAVLHFRGFTESEARYILKCIAKLYGVRLGG